ncbi:MAG: acyl carrier protein [Isosphaerales bacterium]
MTPTEIRDTIFRVLGAIAPEAEPDRIKPDLSLRDQLDLDSMDFLNFVIGLHKELHREIPEADYPKLVTLNGCIEYLTAPGPVAPRTEP